MSQNETPAKRNISKVVLEYKWMIRPCVAYYDEYSECTSIKGRFHQYFIYGEMLDCSQWNTDYKKCKLWEKDEDEKAAFQVITSEADRKTKRLQAHYDNDIWTNRTEPPTDWNKPLPPHILERQATSLLSMDTKEISEGNKKAPASTTITCSIM